MSESEHISPPTPAEASAMIEAAMVGAPLDSSMTDGDPNHPLFKGLPGQFNDGDKPSAEPEPEAKVDQQKPTDAPPVVSADHAPYAPTLPEGAAERFAAIGEEIAALGAKYDSGEIEDPKAYHAQVAALIREQTTLQIRAEIAEEHARSTAANEQAAWNAANAAFASSPDNLDYIEKPVLADAMQGQINRLWADQALRAQGFAAVLAQAKANVAEAFGIEAKSAPGSKPSASIKVPAQPSAPYSLTDIPGGTAPSSDPFASVDAKTPIGMVEAVMDMPPEKREAWLNRRI
jgi:hypothetical protein